MNAINTFNALGPQSGCMRGMSRQQSSKSPNFGASPSITKAMDQFLTAVNLMKEVVMVPNRLKDEKYYPAVQKLPPGPDGLRSSIPSLPSIASQLSLATGAGGGGTVLFGSRTGSPNGSSMDSTASNNSVVALSSAAEVPVVEDPDLLLCYKMVDAVRNDLVNGPAYDPVVTTARFVSHSYPHGGSGATLQRIPTTECFSAVYGGSASSPVDGSAQSSRAQSPALEEIASIISQNSSEMMLADETRFAGFIRAQMQHFLNALQQLTEMAYFLTRTYQEKIGMPEDRLS